MFTGKAKFDQEDEVEAGQVFQGRVIVPYFFCFNKSLLAMMGLKLGRRVCF